MIVAVFIVVIGEVSAHSCRCGKSGGTSDGTTTSSLGSKMLTTIVTGHVDDHAKAEDKENCSKA